MKVTVGDRTYKVYWSHALPNPDIKMVYDREGNHVLARPWRGSTTCTIVEFDSDGLDINTWSMCARVHQSDQFCKEGGRVESMKKVLSHPDTNLPRETRRAIWEAYWNRPRSAPKAKPEESITTYTLDHRP